MGTLGSGLALFIIAFAFQTWIYMAAQLVSGFAWALIAGGMINYVLERVPADDRPAHLAWYNTAVNAGILICGLFVPMALGMNGPHGASPESLYWGMGLGTLFRLIAGGIILVWG